ncbi:calmodulin-binding transcription activator 4-like isoform X2 [Iris pallida]|uniref:Calmodulin-binding transcription activator 4-like isoform X2 n=1 Tax=Iris pallida TaxID=29817 RepID=A0AAX6GGZ3_IRIPA|nr:calmodulin-binding transcription activator 4-like isoform X2 [Iris pallida]
MLMELKILTFRGEAIGCWIRHMSTLFWFTTEKFLREDFCMDQCQPWPQIQVLLSIRVQVLIMSNVKALFLGVENVNQMVLLAVRALSKKVQRFV